MKDNKSLHKYFLYSVLVLFLFFNQKLSNSQETNDVKKIIIEDQPKNQRLLSPPTDKSEKKIKLIPPKEIQNKIAEEEKKQLEIKQRAEEKRKKELELKKKAEEKRKKELELKKKAEEERKIAAEKEKKKENIVKEIQVIQDQKNKEKVQENESKEKKLKDIERTFQDKKKELDNYFVKLNFNEIESSDFSKVNIILENQKISFCENILNEEKIPLENIVCSLCLSKLQSKVKLKVIL